MNKKLKKGENLTENSEEEEGSENEAFVEIDEYEEEEEEDDDITEENFERKDDLNLRNTLQNLLQRAASDSKFSKLVKMDSEESSLSQKQSFGQDCTGGDVELFKMLLKQGRSIHDASDDGESLLSMAASSGYYDLCKILLAMNTDVEDRGRKGDCSPLMEASCAGYEDIIRLFIEHGAKVNARSASGNTALHYASCNGHEEAVRLLIEAGADVEVHNDNGHTPLMEAASSGKLNVAKILLESGAGINTHSNEFKETALTLACYKGHLELVKYLLQCGADHKHKTDEMHTALMEASMDGHVEVARLLLDNGAQVNMPSDSYESPLTLAACGGHMELASLLLERKANVEEANDEGYTPLMEAAREGHEDMCALLLAHAADINAQTEETQETPLTLACCGGFLEVADFLIKSGADIELGCSTPLMEASQEGHLDLVKYLLNCGANVHAKAQTGDTSFTLACENGHTDVAEVLLIDGSDLEHEAEGGRTALMKAARSGHLCTVQFLINQGADVNKTTSNNDQTVLSSACVGGHLQVVDLLLKNNANVAHVLKDGSTMLIEAAKGGHTPVVKLLFDWVSKLEHLSSEALSPASPTQSTHDLCIPRVSNHEHLNNYRKITNLNNTFINNNLSNNIFNNNNLLNNHNLLNTLNINNLNNNILNANINNNNNNNNCNSFLNNTLLNNTIVNTKHINITTLTTTTTPSNKSTNVVTKIIPKNTDCSEIIPTFSQHPPSSICCNNGLSEVAGQQALSLPSHIAPFTSLDSAGVSEEFKITLEKNNSLSSDTERKSPNKKDSNKQPTPTSPSPPLSTSLQNHLKKFNETSAAPIQTSSKQTSTTLTDSTINRTCSNIALNTQSPKLTFSSQDTVISPSKNKLMKMQPAEPSKTSSTSLLTLSTSTSSVASSNFTFCKNITDKLCAAPCEGDHESKKEDVLKNTGELDFNTILFLAELNLSQQQHQQSVLFDENKDKNNNIFSDFSNTSLSCYPETQMMQHDYQQQATDSNNKLWQQQFEQMLHWQQQQQLVTQQFLQQQQLKQQQHMAQQLQKQRLQLMQQEQLQKSQEIQNFKINKVKSNKSLSGEVDEVKETYKNLSEKLSKVAIKETVRQSDIYQEAIKSQEKEEPKSEEALKPESSSASLPPTTTTTASSSNNKESTASANITAKCNCIDAPTTKLSSLSTSTTSTSIAIPTTSTIPITTSILATSISSTTDSNTTISTTIVFTTSIQKTSIPTTTTVTVKESNKKKCCEMENDGPYKSTSDNTSPSTSKSTSGRIFVRGHRKLPALQQKQQQQLVAALSGSGGYDPCLQQINSQYCHPQLQQHLAQLAQQNSKLNILQNPSFFLNNINNNVKKGEESNEVSGETVQDTNSLSFWPQSFANTVDNSLLLQMQRQQQEQQQIKQVAPCDLNNEASNLPVTSYLPYQPSPLDLQALQCNMQQQLFLNQESLKNQQSYQFQDAQLQQLLQQQHLQTTQIKENDNNQPVVYSSNSHQAVQNSVLFQKQVEHFQQVLQQQHYNSSNNDLLNSCGQYLGQFSENQFTKYLSNNSNNVLQSSQTLLTPQQQQMIQHQLNMQQQQLIPCNNSLNNFKPSFLLQSSPLSPPDPCHFEASQSVTRCPSLDVDAQTEGNHDTALTLACAGGHTELVELLLKFNANIEHRDKKGFTPLILAAAGGHLTVVTLLLSHNADIEVQSERTKDTALSLACSSGKFDVVDELLLNGANIEHRNASDYTPLSLAASAGYNEIILLLIDHGAEINSRTGSKLGISPLMLAAMSGYVNTVTLLLDNGADINAQIETNRNTALTLACFQGRHEVVSVLVDRKANIEHRAKTGLTPLMEAASGGYVEVGKVLLNKGADVNAAPVPSSRDTALTIAADKGHHRFVELLLSRKAAVDVKNKKGCSPLWLACNGGHLEVVQHLVNAKADVDSQDNRKVSCLMAAFKKGHIKVVKWLVKHVVQFPLKQDCMRILSTITDKELLKWCQVCMEAIDGARANQAAEANRNANNLLLELDREKVQEESRKAAAARKREKKKQKKKKKMEVDGKDESNDEGKHEQGGDDNADDNSNSENDEKKVKDVIRVQPVEAANLVDTTQVAETKKAEKSKKKKKESKRPSSSAMDTKTVDANANSKDETDKNQVKRNCSKFDTNRSNQSQDNKTLISKSEISKLISSSCTTGIGDLDDFGMPTTSETVKPAKNKVTTSHSFKIKAATTTATVEASTFNNFVKSSKAHTSLKGSVLSPKKILKKEEAWKEVRGKCRKLTVPGKAVSRIIGRGGCNINAIREASAAHIDLDKVKNSSDGLVTIKGSVESAKFACDLIEALVREPDKDIETLINLFNKSNYDPTVNAPSNTFNPILTETIISEDKHSSSHAYNGFTNNANHNPQKSTTVFKSTIKKTTPNTIDKSNNEKNDEYKKNIFPPYFGNDSRSNDNTGFSMATHTSKSYNHYGDGHTEVVKNRNTTYNKSRSDNYITSTNNNFIPSKSVSILNSNASTDAWNKPKILTTTAKAVLKTQIPPSSTSSFSSLKTTAKISSSSSSIINNESSFFSNNSFVWDKNTKASVASQKIEPIPSFANESWHPLNAANQLKLNAKGTDNDPDSNFTIASTSSNSLTISTNLGSLISNSKSDKKEHLSPWLQPSNNTSQPSVVEPAFPANAPNREYSPFKTFFSSSNLINNDKIRMSFSSSVLGGIPNNSLTTTTHNSDVLIDSSLQAKAPGYRPPILNSSPRKTVPDADSKKPNTFDNTDQNIPFFPKVSSEASDEKNSNSNKPLDNALFMQPNPIDFNMSNQRNQYASTKTPMTLPLLDSNLNPNAPTFPVNPPFDFNTKPITSFNPQTQQFPIMKGAVPNYSHTKSAYNLFTNVAQNNPSFLQQMPMSQTFVQLPSKDFSKNKPIDPLQSTDTSYETGVLNDSTPASSGPSSPNNDDKKSIQPIGGELRSKKQRISAPINNISTMQAPPHSFNNIPYMQPNFNQQWTTSYQASEGGSDWRSTFIPSDHRAPYINTASHELLRNPDPIRPSPFDPRIQTPQLSMGATHANVPTFSNGFMAQYLPGMMRGAGDSWEPVHRLKMHPSITAWNNPGWQQSHNF